MTQTAVRRDAALDGVRSLAILMVLTIHAASVGLVQDPGSLNWWGALFWGGLARPAVPLFFLCSGALMLCRDIPLRRLYGHNVLRIAAAMACWAMLYKLAHLARVGFSPEALLQAVKETLVFKHEFHFYFLHILLLVYAALPVVRAFVRQAGRRELEYALAFWAVTGILLPLLQSFWPFTLSPVITSYRYIMNPTYAAIGYCLLGHCLRQYGDAIPRSRYVLLLAAGTALVMGGTAVGSLRTGALYEPFLEGMSPGPMLMATGIMGLFLHKRSWQPRLSRAVESLAKASFCIYLSHILVLRLVQRVLTSGTLSVLTIPLTVLLLTAVCWALYQVLSRIPLVKTWLV